MKNSPQLASQVASILPTMAGKDTNGEPPSDWSSVLDQHGRWLRTVVFARLHDNTAVDEVLQDLAVNLLRQAPSPGDIANLTPWLYRVALNQVMQFRRRAGRQRGLLRRYGESLDRDCDETSQDPLQWIMNEETQSLVRGALAELPPQDREILLLKHAEHWSYKQIADHTGLSFDKVVYRLTRARTRLRSKLLARQSDLVMP